MGDGIVAGSDGEESALRISGAWSGVIRVPIARWSVAELRAEASRLTGFDARSINFISGGRNLKDGDRLADLRLHANSKLIMTRIGGEHGQEFEKAQRLERIRAAAEAMAIRSNEKMSSLDDYDFSLSNQRGEALHFKSENDRRALVMGLILHGKARKLISSGQHKDALGLLVNAEEAFNLCDKSLIERVDNLPFLQIDIVWCLYMLKNVQALGVAKQRLAKARTGLEHAHGRNLERLRVLQGGFSPELAIYVRLELLEGIVAFYNKDIQAARSSLESAREKLNKLQVCDESLALLAGMGFTAKEARRALRVSGQDVSRAAEFAIEQRDVRKRRRLEDKERMNEMQARQRYGKTISGKPVDVKKLHALLPLGYDQYLIAAALRQTDNNTDLAVDILSDPTRLEALLLSSSSSGPRQSLVPETEISAVVRMGYPRERAIAALQSTSSMSQAIEKLASGGGGSSSSNSRNAERMPAEQAQDDLATARDTEMEDEIAKSVTGDLFEQYDIDVTLEGEAIEEYLRRTEEEIPDEIVDTESE